MTGSINETRRFPERALIVERDLDLEMAEVLRRRRSVTCSLSLCGRPSKLSHPRSRNPIASTTKRRVAVPGGRPSDQASSGPLDAGMRPSVEQHLREPGRVLDHEHERRRMMHQFREPAGEKWHRPRPAGNTTAANPSCGCRSVPAGAPRPTAAVRGRSKSEWSAEPHP